MREKTAGALVLEFTEQEGHGCRKPIAHCHCDECHRDIKHLLGKEFFEALIDCWKPIVFSIRDERSDDAFRFWIRLDEVDLPFEFQENVC